MILLTAILSTVSIWILYRYKNLLSVQVFVYANLNIFILSSLFFLEKNSVFHDLSYLLILVFAKLIVFLMIFPYFSKGN